MDNNILYFENHLFLKNHFTVKKIQLPITDSLNFVGFNLFREELMSNVL
jgi:hypothetical protein